MASLGPCGALAVMGSFQKRVKYMDQCMTQGNMERNSRERQRELEKGPEAKCTFQQPTELVGGRVWRPYVPLGIGRIGEGGGMVEIQNHHQSIVS